VLPLAGRQVDRVVARRRAGCVLDNRTVFKGINVLPPGSLYNFRAGLLEEKRTYFQSMSGRANPLDWEAYYQELREIFFTESPSVFQRS